MRRRVGGIVGGLDVLQSREGVYDSARVIEVQQILNDVWGASPKLDIDGDFGPLTKEQVRRFQLANDLPPTGIVDEATSRKLQDDTSHEIGFAPPTKLGRSSSVPLVVSIGAVVAGGVAAAVGHAKGKKAVMWTGVAVAGAGAVGTVYCAFIRKAVRKATAGAAA